MVVRNATGAWDDRMVVDPLVLAQEVYDADTFAQAEALALQQGQTEHARILREAKEAQHIVIQARQLKKLPILPLLGIGYFLLK